MGERHLGLRGDSNKQTWEEADFPIVCTACLGQNKYIRMMKTHFDRACRVCERPYTVFRWRPTARERFRRTEICQVCARSKHVCQCCVNDIETGVPVHERDKHIDLDNKFEAPKDIVNRDFWAQMKAMEVSKEIEKEKKISEDQEKAQKNVKSLEDNK
ncbi:unnamed protein product [Blepharisma stoltei]|uniref:STL11/RBM22-like N-terminal domain-containing protein n=1 Tax=Blepharisma stoltei TaxID=1481888 RepID=A0AAU9IY10_9CILI|nr:unnamed protein product [Blepharisma stoltei]